jgi:hypothetical protein
MRQKATGEIGYLSTALTENPSLAALIQKLSIIIKADGPPFACQANEFLERLPHLRYLVVWGGDIQFHAKCLELNPLPRLRELEVNSNPIYLWTLTDILALPELEVVTCSLNHPLVCVRNS